MSTQKAFMAATRQAAAMASSSAARILPSQVLLPTRRSSGVQARSTSTGSASQQQQQAKPDIKQLAKMAQLAVTEEEIKDMEPKITNILNWFDQLQNVDVSGVAPAIHASEQGTALRADQPQSYPERAALMEQAPATEGQFFRVPKIATGADSSASNGAGAAASTQSKAAAPAPASAAAPSSSQQGSGGASAPSSSGGAERDALLQLDFRVGRIVHCEKHPEADSLYVEKIDIGEPEPRTIVSGLVKYVPLEEMQNRMVVIVANLKPRNMRGIKSAGMVLAASDQDKTKVLPIVPPAGAAIGERLWFGDSKEQPAPTAPNAVEKKKLWEVAAPGLRTDSQGVATWNGATMHTSAGPVQAPGFADCRVA